jgi:hypothetical protein
MKPWPELCPSVPAACADGDYQPCLGVLGVPLITVPDSVHHLHKNIMTTNRPLELLHMDLFGPIAYISIGGSKYCLVIVDDYSASLGCSFCRKNYKPKKH